MTEQTQAVVLGAQSNISTQANQLTIQLPSVWNAQDAQVALASLYIYFSWRNITAAFTNNSCSYRWVDGTTYPVAFPDGYYSPNDISGFIQFVMQNNGHYLVDNTGTNQFYLSVQTNSVYYADTITSTCVPTVLPAGWTNPHTVPLNGLQPQLIFSSTNKFWQILGFAAGATYPPAQTGNTYSVNSVVVPEVSPITAVNVACDIANTGPFNAQSGIIASFNTGAYQYGDQIVVQPTFPVYFKVNDGRVNTISVSFYDDSGNPLGVLDPNIQCTLLFQIPKNLRK